MNIALVGYGKMGRMIENAAGSRGHQVIARFDIDNNQHGKGLTCEALRDVDVAIEFSTPETALTNIGQLIAHSIPVVAGTTGWYDHLDEVRKLVARHNGAFVYSPNFSLGVNLFFRIASEAARLIAPYDQYDPFLIESHHRQKKDAPSGTALRLAGLLRESYGDRTPTVLSVRAGHFPGTHEVGFDSPAETITLTHTARNREGFADGAVLAAEKLVGRRGFFQFADLLFSNDD